MWTQKTEIEVYPHFLHQSVMKMIAIMMGINHKRTIRHLMKKPILDHINAHG